ncbi:28777_t:CDS:1, partial [Racocetra persica]
MHKLNFITSLQENSFIIANLNASERKFINPSTSIEINESEESSIIIKFRSIEAT